MSLKSKFNTIYQFIKSKNNLFNNYSGKNLFSEEKELKVFEEKGITPAERNIISLLKKGNVLDIGCAAGIVPREIAKRGFKVVGLDISEGMIKKAKNLVKKDKVKPSFVVGDMANLPFKNNSFDYVLCLCNTITYLPEKKDRKKSIEEMHRVLKKGGLLIITLSNFNYIPLFLRIAFFRLLGFFAKRRVYLGDTLTRVSKSKNLVYQHYFSKCELNKLLKKNGFSAKWIDEKSFDNKHRDKLFKNWNVILCKKW